jgi:hypothetical protein
LSGPENIGDGWFYGATSARGHNMPSKKSDEKPKGAKKPINRAAIDELIRKHKGKNAVEAECLKSCFDQKYSRYLFVGLSSGEVLNLNLEAMTAHMLPANSKTAKDWRARQARAAKREEAKIAKAEAKRVPKAAK